MCFGMRDMVGVRMIIAPASSQPQMEIIFFMVYGFPADGDKTQGSQGNNDFGSGRSMKMDQHLGQAIWGRSRGQMFICPGTGEWGGVCSQRVFQVRNFLEIRPVAVWAIPIVGDLVMRMEPRFWDYTYGGDFFDFAIKVEVASDGNWLVFGYSPAIRVVTRQHPKREVMIIG